jgi:phosphoglycolate phosphatase
MKYKAVIFDLDGTLIDSLDDLADSMNYALIQNGLPPHQVESYKEMIGNGVKMLVARAVGPDRPDLLDPVLAAMRSRYSQTALNKTRVYDGLDGIVRQLKQNGLKLAVLTNKDDAFAVHIVEHFFGKGIFDCIWGAAPGRAIKPDPAALNELLAVLAVQPQQVALIGDSAVDMDVAAACRVDSIGVAWGFRSRDELAKHRAGRIIDAPDALLQVLT